MANKPHLKLNTKKQADKTEVLKFYYGFEDKNVAKAEPNYIPMATALRSCLYNFNLDRKRRFDERSIEVPEHIDYIRILFQSQFVISEYYEAWFKEFGLLGINFSKFNHEILFAISDRDLFKSFITNIENFTKKELNENKTVEYSGKITYIKEFKLLSTSDIKRYEQHASLMNFLLADFPVDEKAAKTIYSALINYLEERGIRFRLINETNQLEIYDSNEDITTEIAKNFDIVLSITSSLATVIKPSNYNLPERTYGFEIENFDEELPIVGVLDTGISNQTPLSPIIVNDNTFNITSTSSYIDNANHGTGVAALVALGRNAYRNGYKGKLKANAKLLSIKILDNDSGFLSQHDVLNLLRKAKVEYPTIKIFVLTICYDANKIYNEDYSTYSYELDKFSYENDCLIIISTGNNENAINNSHYDLNYFSSEVTNLCSPAECMNNLVVGAAAHSLRDGVFEGISTSKEYPTIFTRKSHIDLHALFSSKKINKFYFKPDVIECGGDYEQRNGFIGTGSKATMEILSAKANESFFTHAGTSYSAPLVANIAAQIQKQYPSISSQSIKALIINGASLNLIRFPQQFSRLLSKTAGHGFVEPDRSIFSSEKSITLLIEDEIAPEQVKIFPLNFPEYLSKEKFRKERGILQLSMTLCFNFLPVLNNQLAYCPIHIAFGVFKNQTGQEILSIEDKKKSKLKSNLGWSQNARYKQKPIPFSNTHKISIPINMSELLNENNTFKLAVNCRVSSQLLSGMEAKYNRPHPFSIALTIEENFKDEALAGRLYAEMKNVNFVENIAVIEGEATAEGEM